MKKALLFFIIAAASLRGFAQNTDSLSAIRAVDSLLKVSQALIDQRSFDKALENNAAAEKLALEKFGKQSAAYGSVCYNHARALHMAGIILEAEKWYLESKAVREKIFDREHPDCVAIQHNLGNVYRAMGQYEKAEALHLEVKAIREKTIGKDNSDYAGTLINLGNVYSHLSNYEKAESHYLEAKEIFEVKLKDKKHAFYANCLNNLANLYRTIGEYEKAEPIFLESKTIMENTFGKKNPRYPFFIGNMAGVYLEMGNYEKAEPLYIECRDILENTVGKENPDYALSLSNLGMVYMRMGNHEKSLAFFREARDILLKTVGKDNVQYAHSLNFLATSYVEMDKFAEAEALQLEAKSILEKALGKENIDYASCLINLSTLYAQTGDYDKVEALSLETMPILEKILGREHPSYTSTLLNLTVIYEITGRLSESESLLKEVTTLEQARLSKGVSFLPERELMNYVAAMNKSEIHLGSYVLVRSSRGEISGNLPAFNYDQTLFHKGFLLSSAVRLNRLAMSTPDAAEVNNRLKGYRRRLAAEYAKPIADRKGLKELEEQANTFEKELARLVAGYEETNRQVNWQSVQHSLKADEAAIEFIHFQYASPKVTDSIVYAALLLRPSWPQPRMIGLFEQKAIQPLLSAANPGAVAEKLYASRGGKKRGRAAKNEGIVVGIGESASLWQLVWQPLDSLLQGVKTVYFSPSGLLHQINLSAVPIPGAGDQTLADRYSLVHLGSTRQLVSGSGSGNSSGNSSGKSAALFGGLQFDTPATAPGARGNVWNYLPGTEKEIRNIAKTLGKAGYTVQSSAGYDGTETVFKTLGTNNVSSPAVLHIATHGFFFPDPKDTVNRASFAVDREPVFKTSDNPLLRSGLLFAGANPAWAGGKTPEGQDDGILTAYEISQMNLSNTELVVLSACETGLGDIQGNEGVYGLQRAFKIAGAKYLIMSLWQVPDKETSEFMTAFYRKWLEEKMEIPDAFRAAQKEMREQGLVPYQWAGFVLIE